MVLITGASGFLGSHLVRYLSGQGVRCCALYHHHPPMDGLQELPGIVWMECDLLDVFEVGEAMRGVTEIYHCAALLSFDRRMRDEMLHFNPESTANIVNEALRQGVRKMVYVSSVAALGRTGDATKEINEDVEWSESKYNSAYGLSKYLAEMEVWRGIGEGLNAVIINPGIILGAGDWDSGSAQLMKVANGEFPFYTNGVTSWVGVDDVVRIMALLMGSEIEAERFIVSAGNFSFRQVFTLMAGALNKKPPRYYANPFVTGIAWRWGALRSAVLSKTAAITKETATNAHSLSIYNNRKLQDALPGFAYTPLNDAIGVMARHYMAGNQNLHRI